MRLSEGRPALPFAVRDIHDRTVSLQDYAGEWVLVSFLRFITCPRCSIRIHSLTLSYPTLRENGLQVVAFVESSDDLILQQAYALEAPFPIIADQEQRFYRLYGVKNSRFGLFWGGLMRKAQIREAASLGFGQPKVIGNDYRMPADFIIDPQQIVRVAHYGHDSGDHLTFTNLQKTIFPLTKVAVKS